MLNPHMQGGYLLKYNLGYWISFIYEIMMVNITRRCACYEERYVKKILTL